jgi:hypothetical protein
LIVEIPVENLMGEAAKGFLYYAAFCFRAFDYGYWLMQEQSTQLIIEYMSQREAFGKKSASFRH